MEDNNINNMALVNIVQAPSDLTRITELPVRVTWDVRHAEPVFSTDFEISEELSGDLVNATFMYACWTEQLGQPSCMGFGEKCPDHPNSSSGGIMLMLATTELGLVYITCFGLMNKWAVGLVQQATRNEGSFQTHGRKAIKTKFGIMNIPGLAK